MNLKILISNCKDIFFNLMKNQFSISKKPAKSKLLAGKTYVNLLFSHLQPEFQVSDFFQSALKYASVLPLLF